MALPFASTVQRFGVRLSLSVNLPSFSLSFGALKDYGVTRIACSMPDLLARGLNNSDFLIEVEPLDAAGMQALIRHHDKVLNF